MIRVPGETALRAHGRRLVAIAVAVVALASCSATDDASTETVADGGDSGGGDSGGGTQGDAGGEDLDGILAEHNKVRASVNPPANPAIPPLTWSSTVAATAQAWAKNCKFEHSSSKYGENLYADTGQGQGKDVVLDWASEVADYDYATNACSGTCGHYTQVVWAKSLRLGCARERCTQGSPFGGTNGGAWSFWVCNYDPPGNFNDERPY